MNLLIFILLAIYSARCYDSSDLIQKPFKVYWNVPSFMCTSKKIHFENLYEKYGIIQNTNDSFLGDKITIMYEDYLFPALINDSRIKFKNGGIPQEGDLDIYLKKFRKDVDEKIPDKDFSGVAIIDQETFRPAFRQNFANIELQKHVSYELERKMHWKWPKLWIETEAKLRFEKFAKQFMQTTLKVAKQMRPNALWGYYGFPYCFNDKKQNCHETVTVENDCTHWLWEESTALFPSLYSSMSLTPWQLKVTIQGRVLEATRVSRGRAVILPYVKLFYSDSPSTYFNKKDLNTMLKTLYKSDASGFIIWVSSKDVNTVSKCNKLLNLIDNFFGPAIAEYTKPGNIIKDKIKKDSTATFTIKPITDSENNMYTNNTTTRNTTDPIIDPNITDIHTITDPIINTNTTDIYTSNTTTRTIFDPIIDPNKTNKVTNNITTKSITDPIIDPNTTDIHTSNTTPRTIVDPIIDTNKIDKVTNNITTKSITDPIIDPNTIDKVANNITPKSITDPIIDPNTIDKVANNITTMIDPIIDTNTTDIHTNNTYFPIFDEFNVIRIE